MIINTRLDAGLLESLTQSGDDAEKTMTAVRPLWGKVFHTWTTGKTYPMGAPKLFWSVTGEDPFVLSPSEKLRVELEVPRARKDGK